MIDFHFASLRSINSSIFFLWISLSRRHGSSILYVLNHRTEKKIWLLQSSNISLLLALVIIVYSEKIYKSVHSLHLHICSRSLLVAHFSIRLRSASLWEEGVHVIIINRCFAKLDFVDLLTSGLMDRQVDCCRFCCALMMCFGSKWRWKLEQRVLSFEELSTLRVLRKIYSTWCDL